MAEMIRPHFSRAELQCQCGCERLEMSERTLDRLEAVRLSYGHAIAVVSGYRCEDNNAAVGGKPTSAHLSGHAVDVARPYGVELMELIEIFLANGFHGFGMGDGKLHFDDHPTLGKRAWMYP